MAAAVAVCPTTERVRRVLHPKSEFKVELELIWNRDVNFINYVDP